VRVYLEYDIEKVSTPPLVHDTTHPDESDDSHGAAGALVALDGPPSNGGVPTFDSGTGKHSSQVPGALGGMVPTYLPPGDTFTVPANRQALFTSNIDNEGILDLIGLLIEVD
jgi:hypothetical protein